MVGTMLGAVRTAPSQRTQRHVMERVVDFLTVPHRACARRASKALWEAVRDVSMEDLLRATVLEHHDTNTVDAQLVVVVTARAVGPFPSDDALVAWSGGLAILYEELQLRFPHAAAIGIPARLAAICPFAFADGSTVTTVCIVTAVASSILSHAQAVESVVLGARNASIPVPVLLCGSLRSILCLEGAVPVQLIPLSFIQPIRSIPHSPFRHSGSLTTVTLENLPLLESIGGSAFSACANLSCVDLSDLPSLRNIGKKSFLMCRSLQSVRLAKLPQLESIGDSAFCGCVRLSSVTLSNLSSLRCIKANAFCGCESLESLGLVHLPLLDSIGESAFDTCLKLSNVDLSQLPSLRRIAQLAFTRCESLQSISIVNLPRFESIGGAAFHSCTRLSSVILEGLPSFRNIGASAFRCCTSLERLTLADLARLKGIFESVFSDCVRLSSVTLSGLPSLRDVEDSVFDRCGLRSVIVANVPLFEKDMHSPNARHRKFPFQVKIRRVVGKRPRETV